MRKLIVFLIVIIIITIPSAGCARKSQGPASVAGGNTTAANVCIDYADVFTMEGIHYMAASDQVITDEKMIGKEIGSIKFNLVESGAAANYQMKDGDATFLKVGAKIFSLKNFDKKEAVAAQNQGKWILYKAMESNSKNELPTGNGITEETYKAASLIVEKPGVEQPVKIEDKEKIKKVLDGIKVGVQTKDNMNYPEGNIYTFYFVVPDKNGIGQIVYRYYLSFQDINLDGYVRRFNDTYKVNSSVSKIITEIFGVPSTIYDNKLGGKQQIYDIYADGKFILRKVVKETPQEKFAVKVLKQGEDIWQNGSKVKDTLNGKFKVEVFMKDTKLQDKIMNVINSKQYKLSGVSQISCSTADGGNSYVLYLCYDEQPDLYLDETADTFVLFNKK